MDCIEAISIVGQTTTIYYIKNNVIVARVVKTKDTECWYRGDAKHRDDGPAEIVYRNGKIVEEYWYQNGMLHRDGGPAVIWHGLLVIWYQNGKIHRDGQPAQISYGNGGTVEEWYQNDMLHRVGAPAVVFHKNGKVLGRQWYENGVELLPRTVIDAEAAKIKSILDMPVIVSADIKKIKAITAVIEELMIQI